MEGAAAAECQRIQQGAGLIQGKVASPSTTVADLPGGEALELDLFCEPSACSTTGQQQSSKERSVSGRIVLKGLLLGRAIVHKKDSLAAAADLLKVCGRAV